MDREQGGRARISNRRSSSCSIGRMMLRMGPMGLIGLMGLGDADKSPAYLPRQRLSARRIFVALAGFNCAARCGPKSATGKRAVPVVVPKKQDAALRVDDE
jgi:hypothetical protein